MKKPVFGACMAQLSLLGCREWLEYWNFMVKKAIIFILGGWENEADIDGTILIGDVTRGKSSCWCFFLVMFDTQSSITGIELLHTNNIH